MKKLLSVLLVVVMLVTCLSSCGFLFADSPKESADEQGDGVCKVGESIKCDNIQFTFKSVSIYVDNSAYPLDKAESGKEFVVFEFEAKNVGDAEENINMFYEDSYCDDVAIDPESLLFNYGSDVLWGNVAAGRVRKGYVAYKAPIGWNKIEFTYKPLLGDKITFVAYNKDINRNTNSNNNEKDTTANVTDTEKETVTEQQNTKPVETVCKVGEKITSNNFEFTFVEIEKYVDTSDWVMDTPKEGKEFVILKFKVKNVGTEDGFINMFYEDSYCDDVAIDPVSMLFNYGGDVIWGDVAIGKAREGYVAYELPIGWEKIEFIYDFSLLSDTNNKITFVGYSSDIAR